jgi:HEAT repeat protein
MVRTRRPEPTTVEKLRGLPWSIATNITNTMFAQFTFFGSVFVLFLNEIGLTKTQIGFLLSPVHFASVIALFIAPAIARMGYKRSFVTFYGARKFVTLFLLATPWLAAMYGQQITTWYVAGVVTLFAIFRAVEETAYYPWIQEFVPNAIRGKYSATSTVATTATALLAVAMASFVIARTTGYSGFMILISLGVLFGFISVWTSTFIPGGAPVDNTTVGTARSREVLDSLRDGNFMRYIVGACVFVLATLPLASFLPLYLREEIGLSESRVVLVQSGALVGGLMSSYLWGWAADRYGSRPVMLSGMSLYMVLPLLWWVLPSPHPMSLYLALGISFLQGVADIGWAIGAGRLLFVNIVPPDKKTGYLALYFACVGIIAGVSQLLGGRLLDGANRIGEVLALNNFNPYAPLIILCLTLTAVSLLPMSRIRLDNTVTLSEFAGIFFRGNPFRAITSLFRYNFFTRNEQAAVLATEQLGLSASALTVDELLEALNDPRFAVRFEAIVSIARTRPHPRLTRALVEVLDGSEVALSVIAAWALGRIGDPKAVDSLRRALDAPYRSIRAYSARALGAMQATEAADELLERLQSETDTGLQMAYATALGNLGMQAAVPHLLALLGRADESGVRMELALALARIVGNERRFIQLLRQTRSEPGTALARAVSPLPREVRPLARGAPGALRRRLQTNEKGASELLTAAAERWAAGDLGRGAECLRQIIEVLADAPMRPADAQILRYCAPRLAHDDDVRLEMLLLAVHTLLVVVQRWRTHPPRD